MGKPMVGCDKIGFGRNNKKANVPQATITEAAEKRLAVWDKVTANRLKRQFGVYVLVTSWFLYKKKV